MTVRILEATREHAPGIRRLFASIFHTELSEEEWLWKFDRNPDGWFGIVAEESGEVVGHYAGTGLKVRLDGQESLVYAVGDVATAPRIRGFGNRVFREMTGAFYEVIDARGTPFCFGFPGERHLPISHRVIGTRTLFPIREIRVPIASIPPPSEGASVADFVSEEFDAFWERFRERIPEGAVRDRARANWRFHARPARYYRMVWISKGGRIDSWAALSVAGDRALVADHLFAQGASADVPEILRAAAQEGGRLGARELVLWETPGGPGREAIARLSDARSDAGFSMAARALDETALRRFEARLHLTPALYDLV